jgi:hypothetical protein
MLPELDQLLELVPGEDLYLLETEFGRELLCSVDHGGGDAVPLEGRMHANPLEARHPVAPVSDDQSTGWLPIHSGEDSASSGNCSGD